VRIDQVRLNNFCGVTEVEVKFAPTGVTIIHGPNEAGKSTLMHAINVLFDHRDDSNKGTRPLWQVDRQGARQHRYRLQPDRHRCGDDGMSDRRQKKKRLHEGGVGPEMRSPAGLMPMTMGANLTAVKRVRPSRGSPPR